MPDPRPVSILTVTYDGYFFARLLVERIRALIGPREYEIVVVDRCSTDGTREWMAQQPDVRMITWPQTRRHHTHGEAAEYGAARVRHDVIVLMDSDAHPVDPCWLNLTADRLGDRYRLAGAEFRIPHRGNPYGRYIHPHFMCFHKVDLGRHVVLRKMRGETTDTGEEATIRMLNAGRGVLGYPQQLCERFSVGHPDFPTVAAGVFHAWYSTRLVKDIAMVARETNGLITPDSFLKPLMAKLREAYGLDY